MHYWWEWKMENSMEIYPQTKNITSICSNNNISEYIYQKNLMQGFKKYL